MPVLKPITAFILILFSFWLASCEFSCSIGDKEKDEKKTVVSSVKKVNGVLISNGVEVQSEGLRLESAVLEYENGERAPDDNVIDLDRKIWLRLVIDSGWTETGGKVYPGAAQKITTSYGRVVLNAGDLFKGYSETGVAPADARFVSLSAIISKKDPESKHYDLDFEVWDKKGNGKVKGTYRFFIKQ